MIKTNEQIETDKLLLSCTGLWEEFRINKTKDPINVQEYYNLISNLLDQQLNHSRMWLSSPHAKEYYYAEMQRQKEILQSLDREWDDLLEQTYESVDDLIERVYELGKQKGYNDIKEKLVFTDTDKEALDFVRQYNFHLIKKLSDDLRSSVKNNITQAVATGENPYSLANKIVELGVKPLEGSTLSAKQRAVMIAKTEVSRAQNTGILQSYVNEGYTEVTILTAEDSNVCSLCLDNAYLFNKSEDKVYHPGLKGNVHRISDLDEDSMLPLHPNCRCTYISVWDSRVDNVNPEVINLTPLNNNFSKLSEKELGKYNKDGQPIFMDKKTLKRNLEGFVDKEDVDSLIRLIYEFKPQIHYGSIEYASAITTNGIIAAFTDGSNKRIVLPIWLKDGGFNKKTPALIHNHPDNTSPLPSSEDIVSYLENEIKYGITTNKFGTIIIKNNNLTGNKNKLNDIEKDISNIKNEMISDFNNSRKDWENLKENNILEYYNLLNEYVVKHNKKYLEMYTTELNKYGINITFIKV